LISLIPRVIYEFDCGFFILKFISELRLKLKVNSIAIMTLSENGIMYGCYRQEITVVSHAITRTHTYTCAMWILLV